MFAVSAGNLQAANFASRRPTVQSGVPHIPEFFGKFAVGWFMEMAG
jgi:hypothetical protein